MKVVPFHPNEIDNLHCLQACVKSVLDYFKVDYQENEVDKNTGFYGSMSWAPHAVNWINEKKLNVKLISLFRYDLFSSQGEKYLKTFKSPVVFDKEKAEGQYLHLDKVIEASKKMTNQGLWENNKISISELTEFLENKNSLVIAKTVHEFLSGQAIHGTSHYVVVIKEYKPGKWLIHDPGLPPIERRKVDQIIGNGLEIFGDSILISN